MTIIVLRPLEQAALALASRGFLVFPCASRDKRPATSNGLYAATTNPATIGRWWRANPQYNIGIRCGAGSGLWALDRDDDDGGAETLARLTAEHGPLPPTLVAETGKGVHLYFASALDLPSTAGKIGPGLDTRGKGGYVVAPPSLHPSGRHYRWLTEIEPAPPPQWLVRLACKQSNSERAIAASGWRPPRHGDAYGHAALASEVSKVAAILPGDRNWQLNCSAFRLGQLAAIGLLAATEIVSGLLHACNVNGLLADDGERQCLKSIRSGLMAGMQFPREVRS